MRYELYLHASEVIPSLTITFFLPKNLPNSPCASKPAKTWSPGPHALWGAKGVAPPKLGNPVKVLRK